MHTIYLDENNTYYLSQESNPDDDNFIFNNESNEVFLFDGKVRLSPKSSNIYGEYANLEVEGIDIFNFNITGLEYSSNLKLSEITFFLNQINSDGTTSFLHKYRMNLNILYKELLSLFELYKTDGFKIPENAGADTVNSMINSINHYKNKLFLVIGVIFQFNNHL